MQLACASPLSTKDNNEKLEWRDTATPFIIMAFLLPAMILVPLEAGHSDSISSRVHDRIKRFKSGEAKALLNEVPASDKGVDNPARWHSTLPPYD
eukprot:scaffold156391_cov25-Attheya_sp.AAC.2